MKNVTIALALIGILFSCNTDLTKSKFNAVSIKNQYVLSLPEFLSSRTDLNDEASLQYANIIKEAYVVVIDEDAEALYNILKEADLYNDSLSLIENYTELQVSWLGVDIEDAQIKKLTEIENINSNKAITYEIDGKIDGIEIVYMISFIEGKGNLYMLMQWTIKKKKEKLFPVYEIIKDSFKTL